MMRITTRPSSAALSTSFLGVGMMSSASPILLPASLSPYLGDQTLGRLQYRSTSLDYLGVSLSRAAFEVQRYARSAGRGVATAVP